MKRSSNSSSSLNIKNNKQVVAVSAALNNLEEVKKLMINETVSSQSALLTQRLNIFVDSLNELHEAGKQIDEMTMVQIPIDMFHYLDSNDTIVNPDLYQHKAHQDLEEKTRLTADRIAYLHNLDTSINQHLQSIDIKK